MNRSLIPFLSILVFGVLGLWFINQQSKSSPVASLVGHWEAPQGGIHFDAADSRVFQLDIMHSFFFGRWGPRGADIWALQFYDLSGDEPVTNDPAAKGTAIVRSEKGGVMLDLIMPDGGKLTFKHEGPPSPSLAELKF
jgi:hypothetical protein